MSFNREAYDQNYRVTGKKRGIKTVVQCQWCGVEITEYASQAPRRFCTKKCKAESQKNTISVPCSACGLPVAATPSRLRWSEIRGRGKIFCNKECQRKGNAGEGHQGWVSDRSKLSDRRHSERQTAEYREWRLAVFERDKYTCQKCGKVGGHLHAHHIKEWEYHPELRYEVSNGMTLCRKPCHKEMHEQRTSNRKIPMDQIEHIKRLRDEGLTLRCIGEMFGVTESRISTLCSDK